MPDLGVPGLNEPVPKNWITLEDDFVLIYGVIQVWKLRNVERSRMYTVSSVKRIGATNLVFYHRNLIRD
jgi:hypothetical protein